jgi:predicted cation transporter
MINSGIWLIGGLGLIMGLVLLLPFFSKKAEEELELFLFVMGLLAVTISGLWSRSFVWATLQEPLPITFIVLSAGYAFYYFQNPFKTWVGLIADKIGTRAALFVLVAGLGLLSAVITSIITPLILAEVLMVLRLPREIKIKIAVIASLAIGLGSALTPWGGPLTAIAINKLKGEPYHADFFFLARLLGPWIITAILGLSTSAAFFGVPQGEVTVKPERYTPESIWVVLGRSIKIYFFIIGLVLLGTGFTPMVDRFFTGLSPSFLYWVNMVSAVLDNASMAAAEISPLMPVKTLEYILMGLLISGIMLIPGNLPNIIVANKLGIKSGEWAKQGIPLGLYFLVIFFLVLKLVLG